MDLAKSLIMICPYVDLHHETYIMSVCVCVLWFMLTYNFQYFTGGDQHVPGENSAIRHAGFYFVWLVLSVCVCVCVCSLNREGSRLIASGTSSS